MTTRTPSTKSLLVTNVHLLDPTQKKNGPGEILVEAGLIHSSGKPGELKKKAIDFGAAVFDGKGAYLSPGFVDLHCSVFEPGAEHVEGFESVSKAAADGGFTSLLIKPVSNPVHDNAFTTDLILRRAREKSFVRIFAMGALTSGCEGLKMAEIGSMVASGAVAVGDGKTVGDTYLMRKALEYTKTFGVPVFTLPQDLALSGKGVMHEGYYSNRLGLRGIPSAAEEIAVARDLVLAEYTKSRLHLQSISTMGAVEQIHRAKERGVRVTAETNPAYFSMTCDLIETYDSNYKIFPPLRNKQDLESVIEALADGTLDSVASAHSPVSQQSKDLAFEQAEFGMISLQTTFFQTLALVKEKKISLLKLVELLSAKPAEILGLQKCGNLKAGSNADFVLFHVDEKTKFDDSKIHSSARNSPLFGRSLVGSIEAVFVGGTKISG